MWMACIDSGLLVFTSSVCPPFLPSTHHNPPPKSSVHSPPKWAGCSDITQRKLWGRCVSSRHSGFAKCLAPAHHRAAKTLLHLLDLKSKVIISFSQGRWNGPQRGKHLESRKQIYTTRGAKEALPHCTWPQTNIGFDLEINGRMDLGWEQELELEPGPGAKTLKRATNKFHIAHLSSSTLVTSERCYLLTPTFTTFRVRVSAMNLEEEIQNFNVQPPCLPNKLAKQIQIKHLDQRQRKHLISQMQRKFLIDQTQRKLPIGQTQRKLFIG